MMLLFKLDVSLCFNRCLTMNYGRRRKQLMILYGVRDLGSLQDSSPPTHRGPCRSCISVTCIHHLDFRLKLVLCGSYDLTALVYEHLT